jgi:hypothetical protein
MCTWRSDLLRMAGGSRSYRSWAEPSTASRHYGNTGEWAASLMH